MTPSSERLIDLIRQAQAEDNPGRREALWHEVRKILSTRTNFEDHREKTWPSDMDSGGPSSGPSAATT